VLTAEEYRDFYRALKEWKKLEKRDKETYCFEDGTWLDGVDYALCEVDSTFPQCAGDYLRAFNKIFKTISDLGIYSLFGDDWYGDGVTPGNLDLFCDAIGDTADTPVPACQKFRELGNANFPPKVTSARDFEQFLRQAIEGANIKFREDWPDNAWFTPTDVHTFENVTEIGIHTQLLRYDELCNADVNGKIQDTMASQLTSTRFTRANAYVHGNTQGSSGYEAVRQALADLYEDPELITDYATTPAECQ